MISIIVLPPSSPIHFIDSQFIEQIHCPFSLKVFQAIYAQKITSGKRNSLSFSDSYANKKSEIRFATQSRSVFGYQPHGRYFCHATSLPVLCSYIVLFPFPPPQGAKNPQTFLSTGFLSTPRVGLEPTTPRLTAACSTIELSRTIVNPFGISYSRICDPRLCSAQNAD